MSETLIPNTMDILQKLQHIHSLTTHTHGIFHPHVSKVLKIFIRISVHIYVTIRVKG